jgi:hypothetical protein
MKRNASEASSPAAVGKRGGLRNDRYTNGGTGSRARQTLQHCPEEIGPIQAPVSRQNFIRNEERWDSRPGRREYNQHCFDRAQRFWGTGTRARAAHIHILRMGGKLIRIRQLDRTGAGGLPSFAPIPTRMLYRFAKCAVRL